jgi:predicted DNA binding CopG/RHH family protein
MSASKRKASNKKQRPRFRSEAAEREFWAAHDVVEYFDWERAVPGSFPALKPSTTTISLRLPEALLEELKALANERDVPYQSLLKVFLAERVARERGWRGSKKAKGSSFPSAQR